MGAFWASHNIQYRLMALRPAHHGESNAKSRTARCPRGVGKIPLTGHRFTKRLRLPDPGFLWFAR